MGGWEPAAAIGVQRPPDLGKVAAQVAVAGGVVGSLLLPPVREPSWLGHHPAGARAVVDGALLAERMRAGAAITSW